MAFHLGSITQRTLASIVTLSLIAGMSPATALAYDATSSLATTSSSTNTEGTTDNTGADDKKEDPSKPDTPSEPSKPDDPTPSTPSKPEDPKDDKEKDEDPYASTYSAGNANAGSSTGSVTYVTSNTAASAAASQALYGWSEADTVILVPTDAGAEVLCAAALAGAIDCPVLCLNDNGLEEATVDAIESLGATRAIIIANKTSAIADAKDALASIGITDDSPAAQLQDIAVIQGFDATETSLAVARYGQNAGLWKTMGLTLANGSDVEIARATTGFAFRMAQPVLLTAENGKLSEPERLYFDRAKDSFATATKSSLYLLAANDRVKGAANSLRLLLSNDRLPCKVVSLEGDDVYAVNNHAESWYAGKRKDIDWNGSALTNPAQTSCATGGVLAAQLGVAHLACSEEDVSASANTLAEVGATSFIVTGEGSVLKSWTTNTLRSRCGIIEVSTASAGTSIDAAANREVDNSMDGDGHPSKSKDDILEGMDPSRASYGSDTYYMFAVLSDGYSGAVTAEQLDAFIDANCGGSEASAGTTSLLRGQGQSFIDAAKECGVNEVYLLAHAIIESAYGTSPLSRGTISGANNFYGIAAFDSNPNAAASYAAGQGWYSPEAGIKGGAAWIAEHYIHASGGQNTVYLMRYNVPSGGNQYATSLTWTASIASLMNRIYASAGVDLVHTGLNFKVTTY